MYVYVLRVYSYLWVLCCLLYIVSHNCTLPPPPKYSQTLSNALGTGSQGNLKYFLKNLAKLGTFYFYGKLDRVTPYFRGYKNTKTNSVIKIWSAMLPPKVVWNVKSGWTTQNNSCVCFRIIRELVRCKRCSSGIWTLKIGYWIWIGCVNNNTPGVVMVLLFSLFHSTNGVRLFT